ncbi:MAG: hypothetical protein LC795_15555 [Acidobacteria bacterium]|nr:hypothetical protein [Acidobacteriota bacterium]MCA1620691.1 hypothetical protein [Acidobacteriota bacterium]
MPHSKKAAPPKEAAHLREVERQVREFISGYYDPHNQRHDRTFAPGTRRFVEDVRPLLEQLEQLRARR